MADSIDRILEALRSVIEPESGHDVVRLGMVRDLHADDASVGFTIVVADPGTPFARAVGDEATQAVQRELGDTVQVQVQVDHPMMGLGDDVQVDGASDSAAMPGVRNIIAVASGKGGVGKSTVAVNLAVSLAEMGFDVGLVDTDIYGPSIPTMMGLEGARPRVDEKRRIIPLERYGVRILSMGFLVDPDKAVIWRGPMVSNAVRQFLSETAWGELDYLIMDLPPGTGDIQLTIVQTVPLTGAVIVSTPQQVALADARKGVAMFEQVNVPVLGIVENMAYFEPPELPGKRYHIFGEGGARRLSAEMNVPFLAEIPIEEPLREACDSGVPLAVDASGAAASAFRALASGLVHGVARRNAMLPASQDVEILYR